VVSVAQVQGPMVVLVELDLGRIALLVESVVEAVEVMELCRTSALVKGSTFKRPTTNSLVSEEISTWCDRGGILLA